MTPYWDDFPGMPDAMKKVSGIIQLSSASQSSIISQGLNALFNGDGKLLRPGLLLLSGGFGKIAEKHYNLAACLEMLHMATLIHDDVIDDSPMRRGKPAIHTLYGKRDAVLMGDYLLSRCFVLAADYTSPENAMALAKVIAIICSMEIEQNNDRFRINTSIRRYFRTIMGKTAMLFSLACHVGASEAKAPKPVIQILRRTGYDIGMAFQIIDDILDYSGIEEQVRKPLGNDLKDGIVTLPLIITLQKNPLTLKNLASPDSYSQSDCTMLLEAVHSSGGIESARAYARRYTERALNRINTLPTCNARDSLEKLTRGLLVRDY